MRDRLIELLRQRSCYYVDCKGRSCAGCQNVFIQDSDIESIADHLLANGVIVPPCEWNIKDVEPKTWRAFK